MDSSGVASHLRRDPVDRSRRCSGSIDEVEVYSERIGRESGSLRVRGKNEFKTALRPPAC